MKRSILFLLGIQLSLILIGQHNDCDVVKLSMPTMLRVGDCYYTRDYKGIKMFMTEIKDFNPELYNGMQPVYSEISRQVKSAKSVLTTSVILGAVVMVGGFSTTAANSFQGNIRTQKHIQEGLFLGTGIIALGAIIYVFIYPDSEDIYRFMNYHNRITKSEKMNIDFGLTYTGNEAGIGVVKRF